MTNSFLNKVSAERRVLSVVNAKTSGSRQLTGLSLAAIDLWRRKVGSEITADVATPLIALADLCQLLSDRSHETFQSIDISLSEKIESHMSNLRAAIERMP
ncbi:hypothetical protein C8R26_1644 [Nitrosomonas oligotropha]|uniref:Uncharacterized protein n=1 Tax=Nitrosomonas oligotropha TaxID=42354 RepID=A0A2T5GZ81_9PROT|nr:hypothetical protein [Nitrosomonas oligotropha]PTQ64633.1 hypothetical protein C8R26_1644 [Nitrosomonas oligotropha]